MKRHRHTPEQIVRKLREGERLLNEGRDITEVVRHLEPPAPPLVSGLTRHAHPLRHVGDGRPSSIRARRVKRPSGVSRALPCTWPPGFV